MPQAPRKLLDALDERERALRDKIAERRDALEVAARVPDPAGDDADKAFGRVRAEVEHDLIEMSLKELAGIAAARERVANGTYGECIDCGSPIPYGRLAAYPAATRCVGCQESAERRERARK